MNDWFNKSTISDQCDRNSFIEGEVEMLLNQLDQLNDVYQLTSGPYLPACTGRGGGSAPGWGCIRACTGTDTRPPPPPMNRMTDRCKNITIANFVGGNKFIGGQ